MWSPYDLNDPSYIRIGRSPMTDQNQGHHRGNRYPSQQQHHQTPQQEHHHRQEGGNDLDQTHQNQPPPPSSPSQRGGRHHQRYPTQQWSPHPPPTYTPSDHQQHHQQQHQTPYQNPRKRSREHESSHHPPQNYSYDYHQQYRTPETPGTEEFRRPEDTTNRGEQQQEHYPRPPPYHPRPRYPSHQHHQDRFYHRNQESSHHYRPPRRRRRPHQYRQHPMSETPTRQEDDYGPGEEGGGSSGGSGSYLSDPSGQSPIMPYLNPSILYPESPVGNAPHPPGGEAGERSHHHLHPHPHQHQPPHPPGGFPNFQSPPPTFHFSLSYTSSSGSGSGNRHSGGSSGRGGTSSSGGSGGGRSGGSSGPNSSAAGDIAPAEPSPYTSDERVPPRDHQQHHQTDDGEATSTTRHLVHDGKDDSRSSEPFHHLEGRPYHRSEHETPMAAGRYEEHSAEGQRNAPSEPLPPPKDEEYKHRKHSETEDSIPRDLYQDQEHQGEVHGEHPPVPGQSFGPIFDAEAGQEGYRSQQDQQHQGSSPPPQHDKQQDQIWDPKSPPPSNTIGDSKANAQLVIASSSSDHTSSTAPSSLQTSSMGPPQTAKTDTVTPQEPSPPYSLHRGQLPPTSESAPESGTHSAPLKVSPMMSDRKPSHKDGDGTNAEDEDTKQPPHHHQTSPSHEPMTTPHHPRSYHYQQQYQQPPPHMPFASPHPPHISSSRDHCHDYSSSSSLAFTPHQQHHHHDDYQNRSEAAYDHNPRRYHHDEDERRIGQRTPVPVVSAEGATSNTSSSSVASGGGRKRRSAGSIGTVWFDRLEELRRYKEEHGNCSVPQKYPSNPSLGIWVNKQRMEYKQLQDGKKSSMTPERIRALENVGFTWAKRKGQPIWDTKFSELCEYRSKHGDCLVPTKYGENPALGRWVSTQRAQYRAMQEGEKTSMTAERVAKLENLGFVWRLQF